MADTLVSGTTAADIPALLSGSAALRDPKVRDARASTTVAEAERPDVLILFKLTCAATNGNIWSAHVAEVGDVPLLCGAFNPDLVDRGTAEYIIGRRHGVPRKVVEIDFDVIRTEEQAAAAAVEARRSLWGGQ